MSCTSQQYALQPSPVRYPTELSLDPSNHHSQPYNASIDQYTQQYTTRHMSPVLSPSETSVFVSDGIRWNEVYLEKVSPERFLAKNLPAGGHNWE